MSTSTNTSMGDAFKQRRADRQQQASTTSTGSGESINSGGSGGNKNSLLEIQAEQENEQRLRQQQSFSTTGSGENRNDGGISEYSGRPAGGNTSRNNNNINRNAGPSGRLNDRSQNKNTRDRNSSLTNDGNNDTRARFGSTTQSSYSNDSGEVNKNYNNDRRGGRENGRHQGGRAGVGRAGGTRGGNNSSSNSNSSTNDGSGGPYGHLPLEQGVICTLRDGFGFIRCADRPEQVFFHFSELRDGLRSSDIKLDDEVQFRIGETPESMKKGNNSESSKKIAAFHVIRLPVGTIVWEYPDESVKVPMIGIVERTARSLIENSRGGSGNVPVEGIIRILPDGFAIDDIVSDTTDTGSLIRFLAEEYNPNNNKNTDGHGTACTSSNSNSGVSDVIKKSGSSRLPTSLSRGDVVEILRVVIDRRTKERFAKSISLKVTERQRHFQAQEAKLLNAATVERGVVTAIKGDYGFLKSNTRHDEVYFHLSNIQPSDDGSKHNNTSLKQGQELKFLVVTEGGDDEDETGGGRNRRRVSARQIQIQPSGSVQWHDVLAQGVTGIVVECPQPIDSGHPLETQGKVRLHKPIRMPRKHSYEEEIAREVDANGTSENSNANDVSSDNEYVWCTEVYIWSKDSPGGNFPCRGGSSVGLYIQNGDTLLFDVIRDYIGEGGTCRAAPTKYLTPRVEEQAPVHLEPDDDSDPTKAIRLIELCLCGRSEGVINALNNDTYGFLQYAERPVDVHFKMYQILPDSLQSDLRRNMGLPHANIKLEVGSEVQFDLSVHGTIIHSTKPGPGGARKRQTQQSSHERENLKAQRILLLPAGTIQTKLLLAKGVQGTITKQDSLQPFVGSIELDESITSISTEQRHPLVATMIRQFMKNSILDKMIYHELQSLKEDEVVIKMVDALANGRLRCSHIPVAGENLYPGLLVIEKVDESENLLPGIESNADAGAGENETNRVTHDEGNVEVSADDGGVSIDGHSTDDGGVSDDEDGRKSNKVNRKKKRIMREKTFNAVRFDKNSFSLSLRNSFPPTVSDIVTCNVIQNRRSGQVLVEEMSLVQRHTPEITKAELESVGIVKDVMPEVDLCFVSVFDPSGQVSEILPMRLSEPTKAQATGTKPNTSKLRKGDSVKLTMGTDEKNGRHVVLSFSVQEIKQKSLTSNSGKSGDVMNPCKGIVLLKLTRNRFLQKRENSQVKKKDGSSHVVPNAQPSVPEKKSRWDNVIKEDNSRKEGADLGCILLTEDDNALFSSQVSSSSSSELNAVESDLVASTCTSDENEPNGTPVESIASPVESKGKNSSEGHRIFTASAIKTHLHFKKSCISLQGTSDESIFPQRGDLVSFNKTRTGNTLRDIRIIQRNAAILVRGTLDTISLESHKANLVISSESDSTTVYAFDLKEVISCPVSELKQNDLIEGILYDNQVFGICRICDMYVDTPKTTKSNIVAPSSSAALGNAERPKLNLTVKKDRGGTIMAQSRMALGPDGKTKGFHPGWTTRLSAFAEEFTLP